MKPTDRIIYERGFGPGDGDSHVERVEPQPMADNPTPEPRGVENTDRELWWEQHEGYRTSIHVTRSGGIGINVGGSVIVKPLADWHALEAAQRRVSELEAALTPSAATKAAYIGKFSFTIDEVSGDVGCEVSRKVDVPWTTIKEIMAAILARASLAKDETA